MISQIIRCYNERKKRRKHRLAKRHLKKIPTINFKKGDHYEICAICLDEFQEGVKLRLLNCGHAYHCKCIDPWLTENRRNCPICKGKVVVPGITDSESENDAENERNNNASERTPLLSSSNQPANESLVYSNNLIFPIGRRTRRSGGRNSSTDQNNLPSTSNTVNNNELVINVQAPSNQARSSIIPFLNRRFERCRPRMQINAEINSPQSTVNEDQPRTSSMIDIDERTNGNDSSLFNQSNVSNANNTSADNASNDSTTSTSQTQPSSSNYGSTVRLSRRQDNIV